MVDWKRDIRQRLSKARTSIADEDRADALVSGLLVLREELRKMYKVVRSAFSDDDLHFLQGIQPLIAAIEKYNELQLRVDEIETRDQYEEIRAELATLLEPLAGTKIAIQVNRAIADLDRRVKTFTSEEVQTDPSERISRTPAQIEAQKRRCECGSWMTLREGDFGHFWGCTSFPACRRTKRLTRAQHITLRIP